MHRIDPLRISILVFLTLLGASMSIGKGGVQGAGVSGSLTPKTEEGLPHGEVGRFFSPYGENIKSFSDLVRWKATSEAKPWPLWVETDIIWHPKGNLGAHELVLHFVNHATVLVEYGLADGGRFRVLTDPVWSKRVSPSQWLGPARVRKPGIAFDDLPTIDAIVISHNHYDHLDTETIGRVVKRDNPAVFCGLGDGPLIRSLWPQKVEPRVSELDWWSSVQITKGSNTIRLTYTPAHHWSGRGLFDRFASLWGSYFIEFFAGAVAPASAGQALSVYFAGDTGYGDHFKETYQRMGAPSVALIPIGAYEPRWFMKASHINPSEAIQAHKDLGARYSMGIHYGTWQLTDEGIDEPLIDLDRARKANQIDAKVFFTLREGESWILPQK